MSMFGTLRALCACALLAGVCAAGRPAAADDDLKLILGSTAFGLGDVIQFIAEDQGFYKAEHLNVEREEANGPAICAQLVASGKGDVCAMSIEPILLGYQRGLRLQLFLSRTSRYSYCMAVPEDSPIRTLADFKGATIGELSPGEPSEVAARSMLEGAGLRADDVTFLPIGFGAQAVGTVVDKRVAGLAYPYLEIVKFDVIFHKKMRVFYHPILKDITNVGYAAAPATIRNRGDVLRRFARALVKAAVFVHANPQASARIFLSKAPGPKYTEADIQNVTRELLLTRDYLPAADPSSKRIGALSPLGISFYTKLLTDGGLIHEVPPIDAVMTNQFVDFANDFDRPALFALAKKAR